MEFILSQDKTNKSPLVLSEFMGTASSFSQALQINPHDLLGVADAINKGLTMSDEEKHMRHAELYESVVGHTSHTWAATIVKKLLENVGGEHTAHQTPALDMSTLANRYTKAKKRLMLFDYDVSYPCAMDCADFAGNPYPYRQGPIACHPYRPYAHGHRRPRRRPQQRRLPYLWS